MPKKLIFFILISLFIAILYTNKTKLESNNLIHIITETDKYSSLDPLDADKTHNLPVARMLYSTPIEVGSDNKLTSKILSEFSYDEYKTTLILKRNNSFKFSNGQSIRTNDIVLAILRMLYFRPNFPVIKHIVGKDRWLATQFPLKNLPSGITFDLNEIQIVFDKNVPNCLFRLSLELFSVIPSESINLETGKLTDSDIPTSGLYRIAKKSNTEIFFSLRDNLSVSSNILNSIPKNITFRYQKISELVLKDIDENTIISGNEVDFINSDNKLIFNDLKISWLPSSRFATYRFNTSKPPFENRNCRLFFSEKLRSFLKESHPDFSVEASIFTKLIPGYIDHHILRKELYNLTEQQEIECLKNLKTNKIYLAKPTNSTLRIGFDNALLAFKEIGISNLEILENLDNDQMANLFSSGKLSIVSGASGFWAQDPIGDVEMYFTKNLHNTLKYVWQDNRLYELIDGIDQKNIDLSLNKINKHIYSESRLGIYMHFKRFYASRKKTNIEKISTSISNPYPWQFKLSYASE